MGWPKRTIFWLSWRIGLAETGVGGETTTDGAAADATIAGEDLRCSNVAVDFGERTLLPRVVTDEYCMGSWSGNGAMWLCSDSRLLCEMARCKVVNSDARINRQESNSHARGRPNRRAHGACLPFHCRK